MPSPAPPAVDTATEIAALAVAVRGVHGEAATDVQVAHYHARGWTAEVFAAVESYARWALENGTWFATHITGADLAVRMRVACAQLETHLRWISQEDAITVGLPWIALEVAAPDEAFEDALDVFLFAGSPEERTTLNRWLALGPVGALAWAAGLSIKEAESPAGRDAGGLRVLAALRGFMLPPHVLAEDGA